MKWNLVDAPEDPDDFFVRVLPRDGGAYHPQYALVRAALSQGTFAAGRGEAQSARAVKGAPRAHFDTLVPCC
mgnify:CR=1